jgi:hypothetical protein
VGELSAPVSARPFLGKNCRGKTLNLKALFFDLVSRLFVVESSEEGHILQKCGMLSL